MVGQTVLQSPIDAYLHEAHETFRDMREGAVADYIPALAEADPEPFGICLVTTDGQV